MHRAAAFLTTVALSTLAVLPARGQGRVVWDTVQSRALRDNRLGDSTARQLLVYLPPSYDSSSNRRYPVLYFLHGFTSHPVEWLDGSYPGLNLATAMDTLTRSGMTEYIVVTPDADNRLGGGFYENSPVTGDWADFVMKDVIGYVDHHYRTMPDRAHRALAGHSMGGFGALVLGLAHPDKFGLVYAMSPCCVSFVGELAPTSASWTAAARSTTWDVPGRTRQAFETRLVVAMAAALSPDPDRARGYGKLPFEPDSTGLVVLPDVLRRWERRMPIDLARHLAASGKPVPQLFIDYGSQDQVRSVDPGVAALEQVLDSLGMRYTSREFEGGHIDHVPERVTEYLLPTVGEWVKEGGKAVRR